MKKAPSGLAARGRDKKAQRSTLNPVRLGVPYRADMQHPTCLNMSRNRAEFKPFLESKTGVPRAFSGDACRSSILDPAIIYHAACCTQHKACGLKGSGRNPFRVEGTFSGWFSQGRSAARLPRRSNPGLSYTMLSGLGAALMFDVGGEPLKRFSEAPPSPATSLKRGVNERLAAPLPRKRSRRGRGVNGKGRA